MKDKLIRVSPETHSHLTDLGKKGETYDQIVERVLNEAQKWRIFKDEFFKELPRMAYKESDMDLIKNIKVWFRERDLIQETNL